VQLVQEQQARVELVATERRDEALLLLVPGALADLRVDHVGIRRQRAPLPSSFKRVAIFASWSHATQHITAEYVCTRFEPRSSHSPASGWSQ
jgi:hypothetical protein